MQYHVAQLLKESTGSTRSYRLDETSTGAERIVDRVKGPVHLIRTHQGILVTATLNIQRTLACSRCLREYTSPSTITVEEEFSPNIDITTGRNLPPHANAEEALRIDASHVLDLTETLRQYVLADAPMKPLCRDDCRGLCQLCGANLNQGICNCISDQPDPRWGILASLFNTQRRQSIR
jgi:uncharacterized protein